MWLIPALGGCYSTRVRWLKASLALFAAAAVAWASVADNSVVCRDGDESGEHGHGMPTGLIAA